MTLLQEAERAEKIRNALVFFTGPCTKNVQDINKAISELSSLGCVLRDISDLIKADDGSGLDVIEDKLRYVHEDVSFTLSDVWQCLGRLGQGLTVDDYRATWRDITEQSIECTGNRLHRIVEKYRRYLESLAKSLESHVTSPTLETLGQDIRWINAKTPRPQLVPAKPTAPTLARKNSLRIRTPQPLAATTAFMPSTPRSPENLRQPKSYERERPPSPADSSASSISDATEFRDKPWVPSPPISPTATMSSISQVSSTSFSPASTDHWARTVFDNASSTPLPWSKEETRYHEQNGTPEHSYPNQAYESVVNLIYHEGMRVSLFCKPSNYRAKIVVLYRDPNGASDYGCLPLEDLHLRREGSVLRICRRKPSGKPVPWVSMKFTTTERMVIFACTFIAMRSQDSGIPHAPPPPVHDDELRDEINNFAGSIIDSRFNHALRIYRDKITGVVRLQASVLRGELDRTPVWTAFITEYITQRDWCRKVNPRTVALAELHLHIFSSRYRPAKESNGAFLLRFETRDDAEAFLEVIYSLRDEIKQQF